LILHDVVERLRIFDSSKLLELEELLQLGRLLRRQPLTAGVYIVETLC
jgi:hypothetical protein